MLVAGRCLFRPCWFCGEGGVAAACRANPASHQRARRACGQRRQPALGFGQRAAGVAWAVRVMLEPLQRGAAAAEPARKQHAQRAGRMGAAKPAAVAGGALRRLGRRCGVDEHGALTAGSGAFGHGSSLPARGGCGSPEDRADKAANGQETVRYGCYSPLRFRAVPSRPLAGSKLYKQQGGSLVRQPVQPGPRKVDQPIQAAETAGRR